jgi:hypothetical protein
MELKFNEIEEMDSNYNYVNEIHNLTQTKYWETQENKNNIKRKKRVSFDDILSNMNLVVNKEGVLQTMAPRYEEQYVSENYFNSNNTNNNIQYNNQPEKINEPLPHVVKHSYIFNKYFKDYKDAFDVSKPQPKVPKTIEEYRRMVFEERIRQINERKRIAQIKPKNLLFISNPNMSQNLNHVPSIRASKNNLRSMNFK